MPIKKSGGQPSRRISIVLMLTGLIALGSLIWSWLFPTADPVIVQSGTITTGQSTGLSDNTSPAMASQASLIPIYLVGAICRPGIYEVERGSYLYQLVERAGGLTDDAASENINLALRLDSNQLIRLPTRIEVAADPAISTGFAAAEPAIALIDLNQADQEQLDNLPGIGPSTALAILEYRRKNGSFQCVEDLMKVPGIKESRFSAIKDLVVCRRQ